LGGQKGNETGIGGGETCGKTSKVCRDQNGTGLRRAQGCRSPGQVKGEDMGRGRRAADGNIKGPHEVPTNRMGGGDSRLHNGNPRPPSAYNELSNLLERRPLHSEQGFKRDRHVRLKRTGAVRLPSSALTPLLQPFKARIGIGVKALKPP